jgi:PAS domain S-box-containing protein
MASANGRLSRLNIYLWLTAAAFLGCVASFFLYAMSRTSVREANETRMESRLLADELRQSSDDLTRMVRSYAATGNREYRDYYQEILDIRDGLKPRPLGYDNVYWDLVIDGKRPTPMGTFDPLLRRMRAAGFTEEEMSKLTESKARSDALVGIERAAIRIVDGLNESDSSAKASADRLIAVRMLFDSDYRNAKAAIMSPIWSFNQMVATRTLNLVATAERQARVTLITFVFFGVLLVFLLWCVSRTGRNVLGGSLEELHAVASRTAKGERAAGLSGKEVAKDSILGKLHDLHASHAEVEEKYTDSSRALSEAERRFIELAAATGEGLCVVQDAIVRLANPKLLALSEYAESDLHELPFVQLVHAEDRPSLMEQYRKRQEGGFHGFKTVFRLSTKEGGARWVECRATKFDWAGRSALLYFFNEAPDAMKAS